MTYGEGSEDVINDIVTFFNLEIKIQKEIE